MLAPWPVYEGKPSDHPGCCTLSSAASSEKCLQQRSSVIGTELCPLHQTGTETAGKASLCLSLQEVCICPS